MNAVDKGKARASSPAPSAATEDAPLLPPSPRSSTRSHKPSVQLRHGRGPLIRDSDDDSLSTLELGAAPPASSSSSSVLCYVFGLTLFLLLLGLAVAHLYLGHLMQELSGSGSMQELVGRGLVWSGPRAVRIGGTDEMVLEVDLGVGMDVRAALRWEGRWEERAARWGTKRVGAVEVRVGDLALTDPTTGETLIVVPSLEPVVVPLSYDDSPTLQDVSLRIPLRIPDPDALARFAKAVWTTQGLRVRLDVRDLVVKPAARIRGLLGTMADLVGDVRLDRVSRVVEALCASDLVRHARSRADGVTTVPDLPGTSDPSRLVRLDSYAIFPSTGGGNESFVALAAHATLSNPLSPLSWGLPFSLPIAVFLPQPPPAAAAAAGGSHADAAVLVARVFTSPLSFLPSSSNSTSLTLGGSLVHSRSLSPPLSPALSHFLSSYLAGDSSTVLIRYDPLAPPTPGLVLPPPILGTLAAPFEAALQFPGSDSKLALFDDLRIEDMKISLGGDDDGDLLCSGRVVGSLVLPATFAALAPSIDIRGIWPDVLVYDGNLPLPSSSPLFPSQQLPLSPPLPLVTESYPPSPTPLTAFARLHPSSLIPSTTTHTPSNATHNATTTLSASFTNAPLFLLPGREDVFQRFVARILLGNKVRAGVRGETSVEVSVGGWGQASLDRLPIEGSFEVGRGGVGGLRRSS